MTTLAEPLSVIKRSHFITHKDLQQLRFPAQSPLSVQRLYRRNRILQKSCPCCQAAAAFLEGVLSGQNLFHPLKENVNLSSSFHFYQASFWPSYAQCAYLHAYMYQLDHIGVTHDSGLSPIYFVH